MNDDDLNELSYSAYEEALSFGLSRDIFLRYFKTIRDRSQAQSGAGSPGSESTRPDQPKLNLGGSSIGLGAEGEQ